MNTEFLNEHLLPGKLGHFFVLLAFAASILSFTAYLLASNSKLITNKQSWASLGKITFRIHSIAIFSIIYLSIIMLGRIQVVPYLSIIY
jgi:cytochrome c-type biogenesis protein CcmF